MDRKDNEEVIERDNGEILLRDEKEEAYNDNFYNMGYVSYNLFVNNKAIFYFFAMIMVGFFTLYLMYRLCL